MSVAYDNVGPSSALGTNTTAGSASWTTFSLSWSHTVTTSGSNPALFVGVNFSPQNNGTSATLAATYAGVTMQSAGTVLPNNTSGVGFAQLFYLANPATGTNTVQVTATYVSGTRSASDGLIGGSVSFTGVNQTTPEQNFITNYGSGSSGSVSVTSSSSDMTLSTLVSGTYGTTTSTNTLRWADGSASVGGQAACNAAQATAPGASSVSMGFSFTSDWWGIIGVDVAAAGAATFQPDEDFWQQSPPPAADPAVTVFQ
jgi:hypothetical protein